MKRPRLALLIIVVTLLFAGCSGSSQPDYPSWIDTLIQRFENEPLGNPPQSIWRYDYKGQTVYYVPPQCCDQFSVLFDADGNIICAPDGGFTGTGDGRCPDFFAVRTDGVLVWSDPRGPAPSAYQSQ